MTVIMGVVNVTPDSFSDGGRWFEPDAAIARGALLHEQGAELIDVGGESTRPGAQRVDPAEELRRVLPVVEGLADLGVPVSIDTMNADTAHAAASAGASVINDVSGGLADPGMADVVAHSGAGYIVMHWRGGADASTAYMDVVTEVRDALKARIAELIVHGLRPEQIIVDPGLGFAKLPEHNWRLLGHLDQFATLGGGVLVAASRKRFVGRLLPDDAPAEARDEPTAVISALAARSGAWGVRVHDVPSTRRALDVVEHWAAGARDE